MKRMYTLLNKEMDLLVGSAAEREVEQVQGRSIDLPLEKTRNGQRRASGVQKADWTTKCGRVCWRRK